MTASSNPVHTFCSSQAGPWPYTLWGPNHYRPQHILRDAAQGRHQGTVSLAQLLCALGPWAVQTVGSFSSPHPCLWVRICKAFDLSPQTLTRSPVSVLPKQTVLLPEARETRMERESRQERPPDPNSQSLQVEGPLRFPAPCSKGAILESFSGHTALSFLLLRDQLPHFPEPKEKQERMAVSLCPGWGCLPRVIC